ncbi:MAG: hypothetical protein D6B25_12115 [Desulfobulbaceae bacterium]|nr:MAG: hypothetical protein D6B25_12115 [Desulfobulbaceae bacterium]
MRANRSRQQRALDKAKQVLLDAERERQKDQVSQRLKEFTEGNEQLLAEDEFADNLAQHLNQMYQDGQRQSVIEIVNTLGKSVTNQDPSIRENSVANLSRLAGYLFQSNDLEVLCALFDNLVKWVEREESYINGFGVACSQLHKITQRLLEDRQYWQETEKILIVLNQIQSGVIEKNSTIRGMLVKLQESLANKNILEKLTETYLNRKSEVKHVAETILANLGRRAVIYLINRLMHADKKEERLQLVKLIPNAGNVVVPVVVDCLKKKPPWYVIRNVVFIISELNNSSLYNIVQPYLSHRDVRVQQQVLSCIAKISGTKLKIRLIEALPKVCDELKMQIIMQIGQMTGEEVTEALLSLLQERANFKQEHYIELLVKICVSLKFSPTKEVISALNELINERKESAGPTDPVLVAARDTLLILEPRYRHQTQSSFTENENLIDELEFQGEQKTSSIRKIEQSIRELVAQGDLEKAGNKLYSNAVTAARDKDFNSAELLRDKLLEINPLALSEVIRLGEIIEEEKSSSITNHHIAVWSELYEKMSTEEFNSLYYAMRLENYGFDEPIVKAGETDPSLYFVNSGLVRLTCQCDNRETFLKRLQPGEVIGVGPFFSVSVWTVSMTAQSETQLHVLSRENFNKLQQEFPDLEAKLEEFCHNYDTVPEMLRMSGSDRREFPRYSVNIKISNTLLDPYGNAGKRSFKGELIDISKGGLCFSIHITSKENARLLLGRQVVSEINLGGGNILKCFGVIIGVQFKENDQQEFSVHVKFYRNIEHDHVMQVVNLEI